MQNNEKKIEQKIYGLLLETRETLFLSVQYAFTLEEAFILAKLEFEKQNPSGRGIDNPLMGAKIGLFSIKTLSELTSSSSIQSQEKRKLEEEEVQKINRAIDLLKKLPAEEKINSNKLKEIQIRLTPIDKKNILMQQIIKEKSLKMFESHKKSFTRAECNYIKEKIGVNIK